METVGLNGDRQVRMDKHRSELEFHPAVARQIEILDELLGAHAGTKLFDNPDIQFDDAWCSENCLKFRLARPNNNSVCLELYLLPDGLRIDFEGYPEAWESGVKAIEDEDQEIRDVLKRLISRPVLVEYKGGAKFVNLFNNDGTPYAIWALQSTSATVFGGYWKSQSIKQHLFDPIYPKAT